jgi:hypothetical protein
VRRGNRSKSDIALLLRNPAILLGTFVRILKQFS